MTWRILHGDCREVMAAMPEASVDARARIIGDAPLINTQAEAPT